ncbi:glycosyltransferase [Legionella genomosp. 1]|uniref:glycosyltransferase n=1 Tax=Legionella genomosp. 1 TaxID=1093625 RepID=UPI0010549D49|nr:glycosyltransferase [Legionella genomosp. 1]
MSVKYYGIYLAYPPTVNLKHEGLGRYLASFLKGAADRQDVCFIIACPSWSRQSLIELFKSENVPESNFKIVSPASIPYILRCYEFYSSLRKRKQKSGRLSRIFKTEIKPRLLRIVRRSTKKLVQARTFSSLLKLIFDPGVLLLMLLGLCFPALVVIAFVIALGVYLYKTFDGKKLKKLTLFKSFERRTEQAVSRLDTPKDSRVLVRLFKLMEEIEIQQLHQLIDQQTQVRAWYAPTAFWPSFNRIQGPKLMCVPDVVLSEFPIGFCDIGGNRFLDNFKALESAIYAGKYFAVYSETIKWKVLVDRYGIDPENIAVIEHAPSTLDSFVLPMHEQGKRAESLSRAYCHNLIGQALSRSKNSYIRNFINVEFRFLFYASQFRPNKNIITLLRAYVHLLRKNLRPHKLILTGDTKAFKGVQEFIIKHSLQKEVFCLHGLSVEELAAFYKSADLVVNPSLSEGGCPFTFTEALSVGTPVVMSRISVAEEVLTDPLLQKFSFFDPYSWEDMASKMEWAIQHRQQLLDIQSKTFEQLRHRNWTHVVNEHIKVLEDISSGQQLLKSSTACESAPTEISVELVN